MTTMTTTMTTTTRPTSSRLMWAILALVLLADALDVIDATVTNIAAPTIAKELHGGQGLTRRTCSPWACCSWSAAGWATSTGSAGSS
jgi:MFS family permease